MRPVQYFTNEYIEYCKTLSPEQILEFLDQVFKIYSETQTNISFQSQMSSSFQLQKNANFHKTKAISIRIPENLLSAFKTKAKLNGKPYQTKIKELMRDWLTT